MLFDARGLTDKRVNRRVSLNYLEPLLFSVVCSDKLL